VKTYKYYIFFIILILYHISNPSLSFPNNLSISNISIIEQSTEDQTAKITFNISWDNSWRNQLNHDAAWVFIKYSIDEGSSWHHATLKDSGTNPTDFSIGTGTVVDIIVPADKKGCFIVRNSTGVGPLVASNVKLVWDWQADGLSLSNLARVSVQGIEMVYVPQDVFYIGDGDSANESQFAFHEEGADNLSVQISTSVKNIVCDSNDNDDIDTTAVKVDGDEGITDNVDYPTGYDAFYMMKYEITEGQWIEFFNKLTAEQKIVRDITSSDGKNSDSVVNRNTISWSAGDAVSTRPDRVCGYLSWMDFAAYTDWACLRPMSELEFEKAARGTVDTLKNEYAWGSIVIKSAKDIAGSEDGTETITTAGANCCYKNETYSGGDGSSGPLRAGIFAQENSSREEAGAGYYGAMDLSGSVFERVVSLGNEAGRLFQGTHGDGVLSSEVGYEGNATNSDWPGIDAVQARGITSANGSGKKGGSWQSVDLNDLRISDRKYSSVSDAARGSGYGGRCVRTAP